MSSSNNNNTLPTTKSDELQPSAQKKIKTENLNCSVNNGLTTTNQKMNIPLGMPPQGTSPTVAIPNAQAHPSQLPQQGSLDNRQMLVLKILHQKLQQLQQLAQQIPQLNQMPVQQQAPLPGSRSVNNSSGNVKTLYQTQVQQQAPLPGSRSVSNSSANLKTPQYQKQVQQQAPLPGLRSVSNSSANLKTAQYQTQVQQQASLPGSRSVSSANLKTPYQTQVQQQAPLPGLRSVSNSWANLKTPQYQTQVQQQAPLPGLSSVNNSSANMKTPGITFSNEFERRIWADVIPRNEIGVKFDDIGALDNIKNALEELVILPLQRPELFCKGQLRKPCRGILLFGPPGTGKTMLAKAVATEAGANFLNITTSSIASKWYGDSEQYVKAIFSIASEIAPCVVFVDEVDSLLGKRNDQDSGITRRIKTEFMVNWDGLRTKDEERILVLAATNRPFDLDEAVIRRLPRRFMVNLPDLANRTKIIKVMLAEEDLFPDVDIDAIASMTVDFSGSDLKNLCVAAAYCPVREFLRKEKEKKSVEVTEAKPSAANKGSADLRPLNMKDFNYAREQVGASTPAGSRIMTELLQWNERYGEGGWTGSQKKTSSS